MRALRGLQRLAQATTHYGWQVRINMLTERASQVGRFAVYNIWLIFRGRRFGNWNKLTAVRAIDSDVPLIAFDAFVHQKLPLAFRAKRHEAPYGHSFDVIVSALQDSRKREHLQRNFVPAHVPFLLMTNRIFRTKNARSAFTVSFGG